MISLSEIQKHIPTFVAATVVLAFVYLLGFFVQISYSLIFLLSYSDILISIVNMSPIVAVLLLGFQTLRDRVDHIYIFKKRWINFLLGISIVLSALLFYLFVSDQAIIGLILCFFVVLSAPIKDYVKIFIPLDEKTISTIYVILFILAAAFGYGYYDYNAAATGRMDFTSITNDEVGTCRLVRMFSNIVILGNGDKKKAFIIKNDLDYELKVERTNLGSKEVKLNCRVLDGK